MRCTRKVLQATVFALVLATATPAIAQETIPYVVRQSQAKTLDLQEGDLLSIDGKKRKLIRIRMQGNKAKLKLVRIKEIDPFLNNFRLDPGSGQVAIVNDESIVIYNYLTGDVKVIEPGYAPRKDLFLTDAVFTGLGDLIFSDFGPEQGAMSDGGLYRYSAFDESITAIAGHPWTDPADLSVDNDFNLWVRQQGAMGEDTSIYAISPKGYSDGVARAGDVTAVYTGSMLSNLDAFGLDIWLIDSLQRTVLMWGGFAGDGLITMTTTNSFKKPEFIASCTGGEFSDTASSDLTGDAYFLVKPPGGKRGIYKAEFGVFDPRVANPDCDGLSKVTTSGRLKNAYLLAFYNGDRQAARASTSR